MKNVLVISTSLRTDGNSDMLAKYFSDGAAEAGNNVEKISLAGKDIQFCRGCLACQTTQKCVINDNSNAIVEKMKNADVIVFATPIYYYEMCGQMKTLLDRANPLYTTDYKFRDIYLLASAAEEKNTAMDRAITGIGGWIECFEKSQLKGTLLASGVTNIGDIKENPVLNKAYEMGKTV